MQEPVISSLESMQSYFQQTVNENTSPLCYLSKKQIKGLDASKKRGNEPETANEVSANTTKFNTPTYDIFHQLPYGEFSPTFYNPFEVKHRRRTTKAQYKMLEATYLENPKPNSSTRRRLAMQLEMTTRGVQVWFQNRRAKSKLARRQASNRPQSKCPSSDISRRASSVSTVSSWSTSLDEQDRFDDDQYQTPAHSKHTTSAVSGINHPAEGEPLIIPQISTSVEHFDDTGYDTTDIVELIMKSSIEDTIPANTDTPLTVGCNNYCLPSRPDAIMDNYLSTLQQFQNQIDYSNMKQFDFDEGTDLSIQDCTQLHSGECLPVPQNEYHLYSQPEVFMHRRYSCPLPFIDRDLTSSDFIDDSYPSHNCFPYEDSITLIRSQSLISSYNSANEDKALEWNAVCEKGFQLG